MDNRRIDDLFEYMLLLINLRDTDGTYFCSKEIDECIGAIRKELDLVDELKK